MYDKCCLYVSRTYTVLSLSQKKILFPKYYIERWSSNSWCSVAIKLKIRMIKKKKNRPFLSPTPLKKNVNSSKGTKCMSFEMKNNELLENYRKRLVKLNFIEKAFETQLVFKEKYCEIKYCDGNSNTVLFFDEFMKMERLRWWWCLYWRKFLIKKTYYIVNDIWLHMTFWFFLASLRNPSFVIYTIKSHKEICQNKP